MTTATHLPTLVSEHLEKARSSSAGRSAVTVYGGREHSLRQTLIALAAGKRLGEHESPGEATLQVLQGTVVLHAGDAGTWTGSAGDHAIIPPQRHDLEATEDAVVLLTVALAAEHTD
ncbi:cupin domain-containing protein [Nocardioides massiliensis]|uniref:Quercetin dioxygenase-like cupin family protein n=1 Tax=Nocardioides massiliensis TaxID=1325935 RepID=A0ABT9NLA6_9ACTN|nr:cupin domain-containing protein [Nocardioides massiliensis]MDP9821199.1 quercetin dioxygenase-like cupin family protein [Nocardioides massiliensis]